MPRISEFFGIVISMYYGDHHPPHFHARYGEHEAVVAMGTPMVLHGTLPARGLRLVMEWAALHRTELVSNWENARLGRPLRPIPPLD